MYTCMCVYLCIYINKLVWFCCLDTISQTFTGVVPLSAVGAGGGGGTSAYFWLQSCGLCSLGKIPLQTLSSNEGETMQQIECPKH